MKVAFYKGRHRFFDRLVQWWTKSKYSHTEVILSQDDGWALCASSSFLDRGVRVKQIYMDPYKWDILEFPDADEKYACNWYRLNYKKKYDLLGLLSLITPIKEDKNKYWCSEANAASLKLDNPWQYTPALLYSYITTISKTRPV